MRNLIKLVVFLLYITLFSPTIVVSQSIQDTSQDPETRYLVIKNDGTQYVGKILSRDAREITIDTSNLGPIIIPMHEIREIKQVQDSEMSAAGEFIPAEVFSTRYFITTNALPVIKGESYVQWNLYGPDIQWGVGDNLGVGLMTTWFGTPIIATAKYSIDLPGDLSMGGGMLLGTGSWGSPDFGLVLPFGVFTAGDRVKNINFSIGYGGVFYKQEEYNPSTNRTITNRISDGRMLMSVAGMIKAGRKVSIVFDSFIVPAGGYYWHTDYRESYDWQTGAYNYFEVRTRKRRDGFALLIPGVRLQTDPNKAFQFGFAAAFLGGEHIQVPMIQWYRKL